MSRIASRRLLALSPVCCSIEGSILPTTRQCLGRRPFSNTCQQSAEDDTTHSAATATSSISRSASRSVRPVSQAGSPVSSSTEGELGMLGRLLEQNKSSRATSNYDQQSSTGIGSLLRLEKYRDPHHLHVFAQKHNTHITLTSPERNPIISVSCGNIGFKKSSRKHYDSAFQLASYVMGRIQEQGLNNASNGGIKELEVTLRGFGAGREAVTKALLGVEGKLLRGKITKVSDATRLKFGGSRSKKPRRLG